MFNNLLNIYTYRRSLLDTSSSIQFITPDQRLFFLDESMTNESTDTKGSSSTTNAQDDRKTKTRSHRVSYCT